VLKYNVIITKAVQKQPQKLPNKIAEHLESDMLELENNPRPYGYKKLKGRDGYRIRLGNYRIIYQINDYELLIIILLAGHRKDIYD
jgi:mRNA interferase RelE/StbE